MHCAYAHVICCNTMLLSSPYGALMLMMLHILQTLISLLREGAEGVRDKGDRRQRKTADPETVAPARGAFSPGRLSAPNRRPHAQAHTADSPTHVGSVTR